MRIFDFARVSDWDDRLAKLAQLAEPERWNNRHLPSKNDYPVLDRYISNTFIRAHDQQRIVVSDQVACFNTGLLTSGQEEISAYLLYPTHTIDLDLLEMITRSGG